MEHNTDFSQRNVKAGWHFSRMVRLITGLICAAIVYPATACATDIADYPLELVSMAAPPVVMVVLDDSSSMDLEFITPENDGTFNGNYYVFPENPGDNVFTTPVTYMTEDERKSWKSQWHGYNTLYYNPKTRYVPWPDPNGVGLLPAADTARPRSNPMTPSPTLALDGVYLTVPVQGQGIPRSSETHTTISWMTGIPTGWKIRAKPCFSSPCPEKTGISTGCRTTTTTAASTAEN